jgi:hypothetical protein
MPARNDFLPLARVGSWLVAWAFLPFGRREKYELTDEAKAAGNRTPDPLRITATGSDHGRQRQTKV